MKHVTKFQKSIFVSLAVLGFVGGMQTSDIINSGDGSAIPTIEAASEQPKDYCVLMKEICF